MTPPRASRLIAALAATLAVGALLVGCAASGGVSGVGTVGNAGGTVSGGAKSGASSTTTTTRRATTTATRPAKITGPSASAVPMVTVMDYPGYFCSARGTLVPAMVVYSDGNVLATDGMGASCEKVPTVSAGWIDPATVRSRLESYFASPESAVDMSRLPVTDLGATSLHYLDAAGASHTVSAYGLGFDSGNSVPEEQRTARSALIDVLGSLTGLAKPMIDWAPQQLSVLQSSQGEFADPSTDPVAWPLRRTTASTTFFGRSSGCLAVSGKDVTTVLRAHGSRHGQAVWTIGGKQFLLSLGIVLPGWKPCADS